MSGRCSVTHTVSATSTLCALSQVLQSVWQVFSHAHGKSYVYSAFYDDRPGVGPLPVLRLIVLAAFDDPKHILSPLYCHVWYKGFSEPYVVKSDMEETGNVRFHFKGHHHWSYTYTCPLAFARPIPTHVSLSQVWPLKQLWV